MSEYRPTARRPIADLFRATARVPVAVCVKLGIHPDAVSLASLVVAAGAGVCFWQAQASPLLLFAAALLCLAAAGQSEAQGVREEPLGRGMAGCGRNLRPHRNGTSGFDLTPSPNMAPSWLPPY